MRAPALPLDPTDRAMLQRRTLVVLSASAVFGRAAMSIAFVVASLLTEQILGSATWAGVASAAITVGTALSSSALSTYMSRSGRRPGLVLGYVAAAIGASIAVFGGQLSFLVAYLLGLVLFGVGQGSTNLSRYAAADLADPLTRGKAIGYVVFASTIGAVGGPALSGVAASVGEWFGLDELVGAFGFSAGFFVLAGVMLFVWLRPDPLAVAGRVSGSKRESSFAPVAGAVTADAVSNTGAAPVAESTFGDSTGFSVGLAATMANPLSRLALVGLVVSQAVMVTVMTMTPLHMDAHDKPVSLIGWVLSAHTAGMFAFAPLAGWFADRFGRVPSVVVAAVILIISTLMTAFAHEAPSYLMFPGLYLLGLGWSFGEVGSSALLTESVPETDQVAAQGAADLIKSVASGAGALASGVVFTMAGFHVLSALGVMASGLLLVVAFVRLRLDRHAMTV